MTDQINSTRGGGSGRAKTNDDAIVRELLSKFKTGKQLHSYLTQKQVSSSFTNSSFLIQQWFLPRAKDISNHFLRQLCEGKKKYIKTDIVHLPFVPAFPELAVKHMVKIAMKLPDFIKFMPDEFIKPGGKVPHDFFWGIFHHLNKDLALALINDVVRQRAAGAKEPLSSKKIKFDANVLGELLAVAVPHRKYDLLLVFLISLSYRTRQGEQDTLHRREAHPAEEGGAEVVCTQ